MALFSSTPKNDPKAQRPAVSDARMSVALKAPWFSEKALIGTENGVYVFQVPSAATKTEIKAAIEKFYSVTPRKVHIANLPAKKVSLRSRRGTGTRARRHKAYVYLKPGDSIQLA
jgi:large subunit ribosomal protein L23